MFAHLQHRISGLPVIDRDGTLVGILTEGDFLHRSEIGTESKRNGLLATDQAHAAAQCVYVRPIGCLRSGQPIVLGIA
ncbi:hypothetical protein AC628_24995 [Bradyrhizobium sp. NAS96.2]|nr:hypothetical protein AC628_24995 [Bradyrhizobium sp. NAS96.2]